MENTRMTPNVISILFEHAVVPIWWCWGCWWWGWGWLPEEDEIIVIVVRIGFRWAGSVFLCRSETNKAAQERNEANGMEFNSQARKALDDNNEQWEKREKGVPLGVCIYQARTCRYWTMARGGQRMPPRILEKWTEHNPSRQKSERRRWSESKVGCLSPLCNALLYNRKYIARDWILSRASRTNFNPNATAIPYGTHWRIPSSTFTTAAVANRRQRQRRRFKRSPSSTLTLAPNDHGT